MKIGGIIGGIGPESTVAYYRQIIAGYRASAGTSPALVITSIDAPTVLDLVARDLDGLLAYLVPELERLARAGAAFAAFASNTPHIIFDRLAERSPIPILSIVESAADAVAKAGFRTVALFGTRSTMQADFYANTLTRRGIRLIKPSPEDIEYIHDKYVNELLRNVFSDETRARILAISAKLREEHAIEAVILGGTELPLLLTEARYEGIEYLDTTQIHVERIVGALLA